MATDPNQPREPRQEPPAEPPVREREVIVTNGDGGRSGIASALIAVVAIIVLVIIGFAVVNALGGSSGEAPAPDVDVSVPAPDVEGGGDGGS